VSDIYPRTTQPAIEMPDYAPGLKVETERDLSTMMTGYDVSLFIGRKVHLDDMLAAQSNGEAARELIRQAVRQMQDEAVTALGLNHWREEIRRELHAEELRERRRILLAVRDAVRRADTMAEAALLVQDEIDATGVA